MGCICSKDAPDKVDEHEKEKEFNKSSVQLVAPAPSLKDDFSVKPGRGTNDGSVRPMSRVSSQASLSRHGQVVEEDKKTIIVQRPTKGHHNRCMTMDLRVTDKDQPPTEVSKIHSLPNPSEGELIVAGWPTWLASVAGEAIKGLLPRQEESFEILDKIGQGTYSSVYKARDLQTGKTVAMKKVRFVNMDPESVRFMAREIHILRKLEHPNVMKLEGLVTSRMSGSLYLVFEYMEHDLAGLAATPGIKFTEPEIKCYMQQLLRGLEHCHSRGILHRDIKGSNLLIDNNGVLKIGDFGLATFYDPDKKQSLTSRVVTLWYRAPELLLGDTEYGPAVDLWSAGCILAELFSSKPIMPGRTEVEQMHKIFKLCGSPSEDFWTRTKLPHATSFKPQQPYKRRIAETFKDFPTSALALADKLLSMEPENRGFAASALASEFFTIKPLPCDPSSLPKYPPSKEFDAKLRNEEARRQKTEAVKGWVAASVARGTRNAKVLPTPEYNANGDVSIQGEPGHKMAGHKYNEPGGRTVQNGYSHTTSMIHPAAAGSTWNKPSSSIANNVKLMSQKSQVSRALADSSNPCLKKDESVSSKEHGTNYAPKKNRIQYSGPLVPPGGNIEDMLKEHERLIQQAFRKARVDKSRNT